MGIVLVILSMLWHTNYCAVLIERVFWWILKFHVKWHGWQNQLAYLSDSNTPMKDSKKRLNFKKFDFSRHEANLFDWKPKKRNSNKLERLENLLLNPENNDLYWIWINNSIEFGVIVILKVYSNIIKICLCARASSWSTFGELKKKKENHFIFD